MGGERRRGEGDRVLVAVVVSQGTDPCEGDGVVVLGGDATGPGVKLALREFEFVVDVSTVRWIVVEEGVNEDENELVACL